MRPCWYAWQKMEMGCENMGPWDVVKAVGNVVKGVARAGVQAVADFCNFVADKLGGAPPVTRNSSAAEVSHISQQGNDTANYIKECVDSVIQSRMGSMGQRNDYDSGRRNNVDYESERQRYRSKARGKAENAEEQCQRLLYDHFNELMQELKQYEDLRRNGKAFFRDLRKNNDDLCEKISGTMDKYISKKFSLDDDEFCQIVKMEPSNEKQVKANRFTEKVISGATNKLADTVERAMQNQSEDIEDYLDEYTSDKAQQLTAQRQNYEQLLAALQNDKHSAEKQQKAELQVGRLLAIVDEAEKILA